MSEFRLERKSETPFGGRTETVYHYACGDKRVAFHANTKVSFDYICVEGDRTLCDQLTIQFMTKGMMQHSLGGFDKAISTLRI